VFRPVYPYAPVEPASQPLVVSIALRCLYVLNNNVPVETEFVVMCAVLAAYARHRPKAWTLAFLAGTGVPVVVFRWLTG
jgi:hypothetical protein